MSATRASKQELSGRVSLRIALAQGAWLGAGAALLSALGDFGAHWLWLSTGSDRTRFLLTLLGLQLPLGALLGLSFALVARLSEPLLERALGARLAPLRRHSAVRAVQLALCAAPALGAVGYLLFTGGKMSRLAIAPLLQLGAGLTLIAGFLLAGFVALELARHVRGTPRARWLAAVVFVIAFALGKIDQGVLPGLYGYLHATLAGSAFLAYALALHALSVRVRSSLHALVLLACLPVLASWHVSTVANLDENQNVRVALMHPNAATTRSIMLGLGPLVIEPMQRRATSAARAAARARARERAPAALRPGLLAGPRFEDAHILLITIDALRPDHLGSYGYARPTSPALDALAAQSTVFEHAYAVAPHSSFSLCSMMTSEYLHETIDLGHPAPRETLATALAAVGYHTAAFYTLGVFHTAGEKLAEYEKSAFGFALHDHVSYEAEALTDRVLAEIDRTVARGEPSALIWAHYFDVHEPYEDTRFGTSDMDRYDGEIRKADAAVERLIREAKQRFTHELIVVVTADHGEEFREHGGVYHGSTLYEEQIRVPFILSVPGVKPRRIAAPVDSLAIAPTLLGLVGVAPPGTMRGDDLRPFLRDEPGAAALDIGPVFAAVIHKKMVVRWPHKLIADLRFGLYELYDLARDPRERENLADREPARRDALRDEVYGWLDSLSPVHVAHKDSSDPRASALDLGRLGDRRAVAPLIELAANASAAEDERAQAARMLGHLADASSADALARLLEDDNARVAAEAAIALGRMFDARARSALRRIVSSEDPDVRTRAAVSLGRLRDRAAVPALIEALWIAPREYEREEAVRWLGRLGDVQALDALLQILPESRTRHLAVVALGRLRDPRAYDVLVDVLDRERLADVRTATVQGLGYLGDARALERLVPLTVRDPALATATESLVRLGAIKRDLVGGSDVARGEPGLRGFKHCFSGDPLHDWDYQHRTFCTSHAQSVELRAQVPPAIASGPSVAIIAARRSDSTAPTTARVSIGGHALPELKLDGAWSEQRFELPPGALAQGKTSVQIELEAGADGTPARIDLDHVLLLPAAPRAPDAAVNSP